MNAIAENLRDHELEGRVDARKERSASFGRTALLVLLTGACYYLSTQIAWALCFPDSKVSLFFPPHAVLVSILLLVPVRHWWAYTLVAACSHFIATQQAHWPPLYALHCEVFDAVKNVLAAAGIRLFIKSPFNLITLREALIFVLIAVIIVPFGTAFWGAAFTISNHFGTHYWVEWRNLGISNGVTAIVLVPAILLGVSRLSAPRIIATPARLLEGGILGASILTAGIFAFDKSLTGPGASPVLLYAPIPLLIWAALRFGLGGVSISMLAVTSQAIWGTMHGRGPFLTQTPAENALALQTFLMVMAIPLMFLAVVVAEEKRSQDALRESEAQLLKGRTELKDQLRFERLATDVSSILVHSPAEELGKHVVPAMERVAQLLGFDVAAHSLFTGKETALVAYVWHEPDTPGLPANLSDKDFPWLARELFAGRDVSIRTLNDFPPEGQIDRATYEQYGLKSSLNVPVFVSGQPVGVLSMGSFRKELAVSPQLVERLRVLGNAFGNALVRARSELALRESEKRLALAATAGNLGLWLWNLQSNSLWATERAKKMFGFAPESELTYEMFYARVHPEDRPAMHAGLASAVSGKPNYEAEYRICLPNGTEKWIAARGEVTFENGDRPLSMTGIVSDITERRRNAIELSRHRQELAHISRISMLGELSASMAHELNQPLTAILSNSQAGSRFLAESSPNISEVREVLQDIAQDTKRAGEVIRQMRKLVKKADLQFEALNLNQVIHDVVRLLHSDMVIRKVHIVLDFQPELRPVRGDVVQLQQVLLNLLLNAFDAMKDVLQNEGAVCIRTRQPNAGAIQIEVCDRGTGIHPDKLARIFEPFQTTKPDGLGLGLSISRSIVEAHGGRLWVENNPDRGATFCFTIPVDSMPVNQSNISNLGRRDSAIQG